MACFQDMRPILTVGMKYLDDTEGYIWVYYSYEAINSEGQVVSGSKNIPALWTVEKDNTGEWVVISIKEQP